LYLREFQLLFSSWFTEKLFFYIQFWEQNKIVVQEVERQKEDSSRWLWSKGDDYKKQRIKRKSQIYFGDKKSNNGVSFHM